MTDHERPRDDELADYLLGETDADERRELELRLNADLEAREEAEALGAIATGLGHLPPEAWPAADRKVRRRRLAPRPALAAFACVALLCAGAVAGVLLTGGGDDQGSPGDLRLAPLGDQRGSGRAGFDSAGSERRLRVSVRDLPPSKRGEFYELWLLGRGGRLVSLGSFTVDSSGRRDVELPVPAGASGYGAIDLSREPDDGDPAHSKRSVLRGPTT